ncbi:Transmembrane protein 201 [Camponotus floridanus]|uniref:Transmembrane protein 201 n=1 Tax=Camponotus floridanus TaxID=104421 RepID=E2A3V1_CAMFO|nr:Transmembrane protein 201 [Camponotus floridanus]
MTGSDPSLLTFDRVSMLAPMLLILVTCLTVFHRLKVRWPVNVNCWFCNNNSKIWKEDLNWWLCSWCEQYNGFSKNGDYMYNIPEQYATSNMSTRYCRLIKQSNSRNISMNHLCEDCNKQENLKLLELSNFEPKSERHYNAELTKFKKYLEKRYPLCNNCKLTVQTVLNKQALWLTCYKMLFFRQKPIKMLIGVSIHF